MRIYAAILLSAIATLGRPAAAAPDAIFPPHIHVTGAMHYPTPIHAHAPIPPLAVQAWYFSDVCIVAYTKPNTARNQMPPASHVYAYWYDGTAPNGDYPFQQWVSPGISPLEAPYTADMPHAAYAINPLSHLVHYHLRKRQNLESPVTQPTDGALVRLHNPNPKTGKADETYSVDYLLQDDRIVSCSITINMKFGPPSFDQHYNVMRSGTTLASDFDSHFPTIPRTVTAIAGAHDAYGGREFKADSISAIPPNVNPQSILQQVTTGLQRVHKTEHLRETTTKGLVLKDMESGESVHFDKLGNDKLVLVHVWASWAPSDPLETLPVDKPPYALIQRLKRLHQKYENSPEVQFIGISLDADADAARAYARKHGMTWTNCLVPADARHQVTRLPGGELPNVFLINRTDRRYTYTEGVENLLGSRDSATTSPNRLDYILKERADARRAGGYARSYLGKAAVGLLQNFESAEVFQLTGDHMDELMMMAYAPRYPPLPTPTPATHILRAPAPSPTPQPTPNTKDFPTSIGLLVDTYPIKAKAPVTNRSLAREVARMLLDDRMIASRGRDREGLPAPERAIVFRQGTNTLSAMYDGTIQIYLNNEEITHLFPSEEGGKRFQSLHDRLMKSSQK